jgi:hypothetical protein
MTEASEVRTWDDQELEMTPPNGSFQGLSAYFGRVRFQRVKANPKVDSNYTTIDFKGLPVSSASGKANLIRYS